MNTGILGGNQMWEKTITTIVSGLQPPLILHLLLEWSYNPLISLPATAARELLPPY